MRIIIDENVSLALSSRLQVLGHEVEHIAELASKGIPDEEVWNLAIDGPRLLITRDSHFTNRLRFNPSRVLAIVYLRLGNLKVEEEIGIIERFLGNLKLDEYKGKLVTLSPEEIKIR